MEKDKIIQRLDELIAKGTELGSVSTQEEMNALLYIQWVFNCENLLKLIYLKDDDVIKVLTEKSSRLDMLGRTKINTSILKATKEDYEKGFLGNLELEIKRVEANSLLDYSYELLDENDDAMDRCACILARIVMEKTLQLLCIRNNIAFSPTTKASKLNQELRKNNIYSLSQMQQIDSLLGIGNAAAHISDEWENTTPEQRRKAVRDIEDLTKRL